MLFVIYFFFKRFIYFYGKADIQRGGETERKIFHPMIHSQSELNGRCYTRGQEPGARKFLQVSLTGAGSQSIGLSSTAFLGHKQGAGWEVELPGLALVPIWDPGHARCEDPNHYAITLGPHDFYRLKIP